MEDIIAKYEPLISAASALFGVVVLGIIIRLWYLTKASMIAQTKALEEQKRVVEERLRSTQDDLARSKEWHEKEKTELQNRLSKLLADQDVTIDSLVQNPNHFDVALEVREAVKSTLREMTELEVRAKGETSNVAFDPEWHLEKAKASTLANDWIAAAFHYDRYVTHDPDNWEIQFLRAVAHANARSGRTSDLSSLRAYNETIAIAPKELHRNTRARLHSYRGAMLKRLKRLEEAENDLLLAQKLATDDYEKSDAAYNLACVYAMVGRKKEAIEIVKRLSVQPWWKDVLRSKKQYFENVWNDDEFQKALS